MYNREQHNIVSYIQEFIDITLDITLKFNIIEK